MERFSQFSKSSGSKAISFPSVQLKLPSIVSLVVVFYADGDMLKVFLESSVVNKNIHNLDVMPCSIGKNAMMLFVKQTARMFPNLQSLVLSLSDNVFSYASCDFLPLNSLEKLQKLDIDYGESRLLRAIRIPNLKEFYMNDYKPIKKNYDAFLANHQMLKSVHIRMCTGNPLKDAYGLSVSVLNKLPKLEKLNFCTLHELMTVEETKHLENLVEQHSSLKVWTCCGKADYEKEEEEEVKKKEGPRKFISNNC